MISAAFFLAGAVMLLLAAISGERRSIGLSMMILGGLCVSVLFHAAFHPPWSEAVNPFMDFAFGTITLATWLRRPDRRKWDVWILAVVLGFCVQMWLHAVYFSQVWAEGGRPTYSEVYNYILRLNVVLGMIMVSISWPGMRNVVLGWVSRHRHRPGHPVLLRHPQGRDEGR